MTEPCDVDPGTLWSMGIFWGLIAAGAVFAHLTTRKRPPDPFQQGWKAWHDGRSKRDNPHGVGDPFMDQDRDSVLEWDDGFKAARDADKLKRKD